MDEPFKPIKLGSKKRVSDKTDQFIDIIYNATHRNPLNDREFILGDAAFTMQSGSQEDSIHINDIRTFDPGKGHASNILKLLTSTADKLGITLDLTASQYGETGLSVQDLINWYKRYGFEVQQNFFQDDSAEMIRKPKGSNANQ